MLNRRGDDIGIRWGAESSVSAVQFQARSAVTDQAEVANLLVLADTVKDKFYFRLMTIGIAQIIGRDIEALGSEANTKQFLRRTAVAPP